MDIALRSSRSAGHYRTPPFKPHFWLIEWNLSETFNLSFFVLVLAAELGLAL
jgi:hypothetical protein